MNTMKLIHFIAALALAPLLLGVVNRTKAIFAGRCGQPLLQPYYDLRRLSLKGAVYSQTTTLIFKVGPVIGLAVAITILLILPFGNSPAIFHFAGDFILIAYLLGLMRIFTVLAALDTGSSFEGMGASREVTFSLLAEVALVLGLAAAGWKLGALSASGLLSALTPELWKSDGGVLALITASFLLVFLAENSRIPIDDPNTHLELTMIHEVMVLDHSGPDLAVILYGAALKFWILGTLVVGIALPFHSVNPFINDALFVFGMITLAVCVGVIESTMARLRLTNVPHLLIGAGTLSFLALLIGLR